ncbi:MAG: squalene--hopene cyclase, partial [Candidatus Magnetoovum sp. WYHC-5]|nr:squalene--hopene cyclase [Candidatus Magnetoovum sp. WYHC-5]
QKAITWLKEHQNPDGGWGECCESYCDAGLSACGQSTPSQTAWAVMALIAAYNGTSSNAIKGIHYIISRQRNDGTWDEDVFTGTGFPKHFMLWYENYRNCFPLMALGKFLKQYKN